MNLKKNILALIFIMSYSALAKPRLTLWINTEQPKQEYIFTYPANAIIQIIDETLVANDSLTANPLDQKKISPFKIECTDPIKIEGRLKTYFDKKIQFNLIHGQTNKKDMSISMQGFENECILNIKNQRVYLTPEKSIHPSVHQLRQMENVELDTITQNTIHLLKDPYSAFNARFRNLMGYDLSHEDYVKKNPSMELDFNKAPKLDLIIFNTLQLTNDFTTHLILRAISYHAQHGTKVSIFLSKNLVLPQERILLEKFRKDNPNIHIELYKNESADTLRENIHALHQTSHIKALLTYSEKNPSLNKVITGGRNLSEMYFYPEKPDNSKYPNIIQWGSTWYNWGYFDDLDFEISDQNLILSLAKSLLNYNEQEYEKFQSNKMNPYILSYPFNKGAGLLEEAYVNLFKNAQKKILVISPYLNFTPQINEALLNAQKRGVKITFISNLTVENDFMPGFLQPAMNRKYREILKNFHVLFYAKKKSTLHVKAIFIDDKKLVLGSVNLNQRSFIHDTELSFLFENNPLNEEFKEMMNTDIKPYLKEITLIEFPRKTIGEFIMKPFMGLF